jgi:hypothetical protein
MSRLARNVETPTTDTGHPHPLERPLAIACHAVTNAARRTTPEKLPTVAITLAHSGCNGLASFPRAQDAVVLGTKYLRDPIRGTKPHGQKTTSFHYRRVVQMTSATFSHCATNASSEKMLAPNPSIKRDAALTRTAPYVKTLGLINQGTIA